MKPTPVTIIRPDGTLTDLFAQAASLFARAWAAMLCLGSLHLHVSYLQAVLGLVVVSSALPDSGYLFFSRAPKKTERGAS